MHGATIKTKYNLLLHAIPTKLATFFSTENSYVLFCNGEGERLL